MNTDTYIDLWDNLPCYRKSNNMKCVMMKLTLHEQLIESIVRGNKTRIDTNMINSSNTRQVREKTMVLSTTELDGIKDASRIEK